MNLEGLIRFLEGKGWTVANYNDRIAFFKPPAELGFETSYSLPVPIKTDAADFKQSLRRVESIVSEIYEDNINSLLFDATNYLALLKKDALFFKLDSNEVRFRHTLEVRSIWNFLRNLSSSYSSFVRSKYLNIFDLPEDTNSLNSYQKNLKEVLKYSQLRLVDLEFQSFSFGVSADPIIGNDQIDSRDVQDWRRTLVPSYKEEVIDVDFESEEDLNRVLESFSEEDRRSIYNPLFREVNKSGINIYLTDSQFSRRKQFKRIADTTVQVIAPPKSRELREESEFEIMQIIVPIDRNKESFSFKTKDLGSSLISQKATDFTYFEESFPFSDSIIEFNQPVKIDVHYIEEDKNYQVEQEDLDVVLVLDGFNSIKSSIIEVFQNKYSEYIQLSEQELPVTTSEQEKNIIFFDSVLGKD